MAKQEQTTAVPSLEEYVDSILPDNKFGSDEERIEALIQHDQTLTAGIEKMTAAIEEFPELGEVFMGNATPQAAMAALYPDGESYQTYMDEAKDKDVKEVAAARKAKRVAQQKEEAAFKQRAADFDAAILDWAKSRGLTQEQEQQFEVLLTQMVNLLLDMRITKDEYPMLDNMYAILTRDSDLAAAEQKGVQQRSAAREQAAAASQKGASTLPPAMGGGRGTQAAGNAKEDDLHGLPNYFKK